MHRAFPTLPIHTPHGVGAAISTLWCRTSAAMKSGIPALPSLYSQGFTLKCRSVPHISLLTHARRRARTRTQESVCAQWEVPRHCAALRHRHLRAHRTNHPFSLPVSHHVGPRRGRCDQTSNATTSNFNPTRATVGPQARRTSYPQGCQCGSGELGCQSGRPQPREGGRMVPPWLETSPDARGNNHQYR